MTHPVQSNEGMVVAAHPIAAEAGASILREGGNAVEAAVATSLTLGVVEPFASGLGGGGYFMVCPEGNPTRTEIIDGRGVVSSLLGGERTYPGGSTVPFLPRTGPLSAAIPGLGRALTLLLERHGGRIPLADLCAPAIDAADKGFEVSETFVRCQHMFEGAVRASKECAKTFLNNGELLKPGEQLIQKALARTLRRIAEDGFEVIYSGDIGPKITQYVNQTGPVWGESDLDKYEAKVREPLKGPAVAHEIQTMGPPSRGGAGILRALDGLARRNASEFGLNSAEYIVLLAGILRETFTHLDPRVTDPDHAEPKPSPSTTHFSIGDRNRTIVTASQTIGHFFGSGLVVNGIVLNDDISDCNRGPGHPNSVQAGHRTVSNMAPTIVFRDAKPRFALGTPGSLRIFPALSQVVSNLLLHRKSLREAVDAGRIQWEDGTIFLEGHIDDNERGKVRSLSDERIIDRRKNDLFFGGVNALEIGWDGLMTGVADPRRDGVAVGL